MSKDDDNDNNIYNKERYIFTSGWLEISKWSTPKDYILLEFSGHNMTTKYPKASFMQCM